MKNKQCGAQATCTPHKESLARDRKLNCEVSLISEVHEQREKDGV